MPKFVIKTGKHQGKTLKLPERDITIGRELECDIRITDSDVSRRHCQLIVLDEKISVIDLKSRNGTYVNDIAIQKETPLEPGALLRVGPMVFELVGAKKAVKKPSNYTPDPADPPLSDDDISSWLSEDTNNSAASPGDTTIIPTTNFPPTDSDSTTPKPKPKEKKEYHSVAEEAADIIKKHWERMAQKRENE